MAVFGTTVCSRVWTERDKHQLFNDNCWVPGTLLTWQGKRNGGYLLVTWQVKTCAAVQSSISIGSLVYFNKRRLLAKKSFSLGALEDFTRVVLHIPSGMRSSEPRGPAASNLGEGSVLPRVCANIKKYIVSEGLLRYSSILRGMWERFHELFQLFQPGRN